MLLWLCGAVAVLGWTLARMRRFRRFMQGASREAPPALRRMAEELARTLGLAKVPGDPHDGRARLPHGVLERRRRPRSHPVCPAHRAGALRTALDRGARTGPRPPPRSPRPLAGVAGVHRVLVEPRRVVGATEAPSRGGGLLRRPRRARLRLRPARLRPCARAGDRPRPHGADPRAPGFRECRSQWPRNPTTREETSNDYYEPARFDPSSRASHGAPRWARGLAGPGSRLLQRADVANRRRTSGPPT